MQVPSSARERKVENRAADRQGACVSAPTRDPLANAIPRLRRPEDAIPAIAFLLELGLDSVTPEPGHDIVGGAILRRIERRVGAIALSVDQAGNPPIETATRLRGRVDVHGKPEAFYPRGSGSERCAIFVSGPIV